MNDLTQAELTEALCDELQSICERYGVSWVLLEAPDEGPGVYSVCLVCDETGAFLAETYVALSA